MDRDDETGTQARFEEYTADLASVLGHADRVRPFGAKPYRKKGVELRVQGKYSHGREAAGQ
jgi:hypothetical protein